MTDLCTEMKKFGKGIGNESRYKIIEALFDGSKNVNELVEAVGLSQPAVSQHLRTLKESNIVTDVRHGQEVTYSLNTKHILELLTHLSKDVRACPKSI
jgi:DNA-binding transcriptional ArsR family regulator